VGLDSDGEGGPRVGVRPRGQQRRSRSRWIRPRRGIREVRPARSPARRPDRGPVPDRSCGGAYHGSRHHPEGRGARTGAARGDRMPADWRRSSTALSRRDLLCQCVPRAGVHRHRGPLAARLALDGSIAGA